MMLAYDFGGWNEFVADYFGFVADYFGHASSRRWCWISGAERDTVELSRRGTQVVRERSAKPLCVGSIPTRASNQKAA